MRAYSQFTTWESPQMSMNVILRSPPNTSNLLLLFLYPAAVESKLVLLLCLVLSSVISIHNHQGSCTSFYTCILHQAANNNNYLISVSVI